jgi:WD40 repeat protein
MSEVPATNASSPYPSLAALRAAHNELLKSMGNTRNLSSTPIATDGIATFIARGVATGMLIEHEDDRTTAQSLLDYWSAMLYRLDHEPPDTTLAEFDHATEPELDEALCPYVGLAPFEAAQSDRFFGRKRLVDDFMMKRLAATRVLALVGPTGSGKSSVLRAGVIPALQAGGVEGSREWRYLPTITPGSDPLAQLARILPGAPVSTEQLKASPQLLAESLAAGGSQPVVLLIDQFEELFTLTDDASIQQSFVDALVALADLPGARHTVLIGMRSDVESSIARFATLQAWFERGRVQLLPLGAAELRAAIEKPAELVGLKFEAGLVDKLIQDLLGEPAALPLLQFTLLELWERRDRNRITWDAYSAVGAGRRAIANVANLTYASLSEEDRLLARRMLLRMVTYERGLDVLTRRVRRDALLQGLEPHDRALDVLATLESERLVRVSKGDTPAEDQIELAHDALALNWPKMAEWLAAERTALDTRRRLETRADEWVELHRGTAGLLDPVQLAEAEGWINSPEGKSTGYSETLVALVAASRAAIEEAQQREVRQARALAEEQQRRAEAETQRAEEQQRRAEAEAQRAEVQTQRAELESQRKRQIGSALIFIGILAIVALGLASYATQQAQIALTQTNLAQAAQAEAQQNADQAVSLQKTAETARKTAEDALIAAEQQRTEAEKQRAEAEKQRLEAEQQRAEAVHQRLEAKAGELSALALAVQFDNPQLGILLAAESVNISLDANQEPAPVALGTLIDTLTRITGRGYYQHTDAITGVAYDSTGQILVTAGLDQRINIWNPAQLSVAPSTIQADIAIDAMAMTPNGRWLAGYDPTGQQLRLWDLQNPGTPATTLDPGSEINEMAFSSDGRLLVIAGQSGVSRVWAIASLGTGPRLLTTNSPAQSIAISPDGRWVLTGHADGIARIWNLSSRDPIRPGFTQDRRGALTKVGFSPNGRWVVLSDDDGFSHIWGFGSGGFSGGPYVLRGQTGTITAMAFAPDSSLAATGSTDGSIYLWALAARQDPPARSVLRASSGEVSSIVVAPNGAQLASTGQDNQIELWDLTTQDPGRESRTLIGHSSWIAKAVYSPDGTMLVSAGEDRSLRMWDLTNAPPTEDSLPRDPQALIDLACQVAGRNPTDEEWDQQALGPQAPVVCTNE